MTIFEDFNHSFKIYAHICRNYKRKKKRHNEKRIGTARKQILSERGNFPPQFYGNIIIDLCKFISHSQDFFKVANFGLLYSSAICRG